jgi:arylsulfatase A-like enzyme
MRGPGEFSGGKVVDGLISQIDIFPTLCDLLGLERPDWLQGKSFMPLVRGEVEEINEAIFAEVSYHAAYEPQRAVRTQRYKYIRRYSDHVGPVLPNCDDSPSKDMLLANGWKGRPIPQEQLYDLDFDPNEAGNRATDPSMSTVLADMRSRLSRWMQTTNDPLLAGSVPAAPGTQVNRVDGLSPSEPPETIP